MHIMESAVCLRQDMKLLSKKIALVLLVVVWFSVPASALTGNGKIGFFVGDSDAYICLKAIKNLELPGVDVEVFTKGDIEQQRIEGFISCMDVAVVDIMQTNPADWLLAGREKINPNAAVYSVRSSSHTKDFLDAGFIADKTVKSYYQYTTTDNLKNLILFLANRHLKSDIMFEPPAVLSENAIYHPDSKRLFTSMLDYFNWYRQSGHYRKSRRWSLIVTFPTFTVEGKKQPVDALIHACERQGVNAVTLLYSHKQGPSVIDRLISEKPLKNGLGSIIGFTFKFSSMLSSDMYEVFSRADVPVFNPQYLFFTPRKEWLASPQGIAPMGIAMQFSTPELSGLVEPTVIGVKDEIPDDSSETRSYVYVPASNQVEMLAKRMARWHALRDKPNKDKDVVLVYYNHGAGKQNIGASYLNVARSITMITNRLKAEGYTITGEISEDKIMDLLIKTGRNIGSWAPGEMDELLSAGDVVKIDIPEYKKWIFEIDPDYLAKVEKDWGKPEDSNIMIHEGKFIIPCIRMGNLFLVPQPSRGWNDDPEKLYHSDILFPHHQYTAFYLWLQKVLRPDAMISLGTHGTHEWLPGKQAGLTHSCAPEVLIGDIPSLYPYIVDDVGEGIQAKRRGRAVIIDHSVPPFRKGGIYEEYSKIAAFISEYEIAGSGQIQAKKLERIAGMVRSLGLDKDLELSAITGDSLEAIEHYILSLKTEMIPYGLHTFGISAAGQGLEETAVAIASQSEKSAEFYRHQLLSCGPSEFSSLVRGLRAGYLPPASGNDPVRNPESLPTGRNFYAFDPEKVPSREAWELGKKAGDQMIEKYLKDHHGQYPEQIGVVLWSVETIRNQGINTAMALSLLGMKPVWDKRDKVKGVVPIPASELKRPRIDVLLQISGLFRDTFPTVVLLLDNAVKKAAALTDIENYVRKHSESLEQTLIAGGYSHKQAKRFSTVRIFSARPGAYGTKVDNMAGASGLWEDDAAIAENAFIDMVSFGYSRDMWGEKVQDAYRENLKRVDVTIHSISSNLYGTMDNDDMFQYLGGLSMAVRKESGMDPDVFISQQKTLGAGRIEPLAETIGKELRSRYLNPKWIEGMQKEGYAGAREMSEFVENMWGWQVTTPKAIDRTKWEQTFAVYVEDKYGMDIQEFFNKENPWAYQSITGRMLEAIRKEYWEADEETRKKLAVEHVMSVINKGVACCDHTCNNPLLNQMVVSIVSIPGVMSPVIVEEFKIAIEKAAGKDLAKQVETREQLLSKLQIDYALNEKEPAESQTQKKSQQKTAKAGEKAHTVEGYKMEQVQSNEESAPSSSGVQWFASIFIILILGMVVFGVRRQTRDKPGD
ncbi:MAG: hypothetical protein C4B58_14730 [Deltaproteobacteria bacterium]|nr:MAG: hypothetical protein C4B58_14730 [Deltaproteobacteria bacterium]